MPALEIHPWSDDFRGEAARLLAERHARERTAEPLLPEVEDFAAHLPEGDGAVATRGGEAVAYLVASVGEERAEVGLAGVAASEPEAVRLSGRDTEAQDFEGEWANLWNEPEFPLHVVAERDGRVVGHALLYDRPTGDLRVPESNIDLGHAATVADVRGSGVGLALTAHILDWAHEHGFRSMTTDWRSVDLLAARFWPRRGWRPTHDRLYRAVP
jgi:GNAT superfamily N-acetyltransferase